MSANPCPSCERDLSYPGQSGHECYTHAERSRLSDATVVAMPSDCTCHVFDIGHRCEACVRDCSAAGHPYTEVKNNGQHHMCGVILK